MNNFVRLPDGSGCGVVAIKCRPFLKRWIHKLFSCPTFWKLKPFFHCPKCGKGMRCYWDGTDVAEHGTGYCYTCAKELEA